MSETERTIEPERYTKNNALFLDHDDGGYINSYSVADKGKETGITVVNAGHSRKGAANRQTISFRGEEYNTLRLAIYAYEDFIATPLPNTKAGE